MIDLYNIPESNSKSEDTSLDDIFDNHGQIVGYGDYYQTETLADIKIEIMAWHKAERAKLFEQIRSEVIGEDEEMHRLNPSMNTRILQMVRESNYLADNQNKLRAEQREALTRMEQS